MIKMAQTDRSKLLTTIQAKVNQIEMFRQRGVDLSKAVVFYNRAEKNEDINEETYIINEDELFPEWIDVIRMKPKEQDAIIKKFRQNYSFDSKDGKGKTISINARYPSRHYPVLDKKTRHPLDHIYAFYPTPNEQNKIPNSEFTSIIQQFYEDVESNQAVLNRHNRLDDVVIVLLVDNKINIPGDIKADYGKRIQIMYHDQIYPPSHIMYSIHEKVEDDEAIKLLAEIDAKKLQLPRLYENEQICRYYGWYPGDVIRIYRRSSGISSIIREMVVEVTVVPGDPPFPKVLSKIIY